MTMRETAAAVLKAFEEIGVGLNPSSRLARQIDAYLDRKGVLPQIIPPEHEMFDVAVEGRRDLNQILFAVRQLVPVVPRDVLREQLRRIVLDSALPQDSAERSPGRDAQCELFVAGLCARAGLAPVFDESPDLRCTLDQLSIGVAVKRIKAPPERFERRFQQRTCEAAEQIERSKVPGVIVADISQSLNPTNWWVPQEVADEEFDRTWRQGINTVSDRFRLPLQDWTRGKGVRGVILMDHILRSHANRQWQMELLCSPINLCPFNQRRHREFEEVNRRFQNAIRYPGDVRPATK